MSNYPIHVAFPGRLVFVGFGSIGQGVLPLILRHIGIRPDQITIVTADEAGEKVAAEYGVRFIKHPLTRENFKHVLDPLVGRGDFLLNLSVDVSSVALIKFCWEKGALYLDTCIEPWAGGYTDPTVSAVAALELRAARDRAGAARDDDARADRRADAWREPGPGLAFRQAGAAEHRGRHGRRPRRAQHPRRVGGARAAARRQGDPHRRARHAGRIVREGAERVRQHVVGGRLRGRGLPAGRARLGLAREELAA